MHATRVGCVAALLLRMRSEAHLEQTKLFTLSEVPITQIFSDKAGNSSEISAHMRSTMDDLGLSATEVGASSIFSGEEEVFAFARAVVRVSSPSHE